MKINKGYRFPWEIIEKAVLLHKKENLTLRAISEKINYLGVHVSHKTIFEWLNKFSDSIKIKKIKKEKNYSIDVSEVRCNGKNMFMYKALNSKNKPIELFFFNHKNMKLAKKCLVQMIEESKY